MKLFWAPNGLSYWGQLYRILHNYELQGHDKPPDRVCEGGEVDWVLRKQASSCLIRLFTFELGARPCKEGITEEIRVQYGGNDRQHQDMVELLSHFDDLFQEPKGLPPPQSHDHMIPLEEGKGPVSV